jgi:hypothetical protein
MCRQFTWNLVQKTVLFYIENSRIYVLDAFVRSFTQNMPFVLSYCRHHNIIIIIIIIIIIATQTYAIKMQV